MGYIIWGALSGLACLIRKPFYMGSIVSQLRFDCVPSIDPSLWPRGCYSHAEPIVMSDCLWSPLGPAK